MKDGFLSKFKAVRYHANPTHTYFSFSDWSTLWNQTTKNSTEFHTDPHNTKLEGYRHLTFTASSHTQHYYVIWIC